MEVLENKYKDPNKSPLVLDFEYPKEDFCEFCGSRFKYDENDIEVGEFGCAAVTCPCCGKLTLLNDEDDKGLRLTLDNLEFPRHFHHTCINNGAADISNDKIKELIEKGIRYLRANWDEYSWSAATGTVFVKVQKSSENQEYYVAVSKDYYETVLHYSIEDCFLDS